MSVLRSRRVVTPEGVRPADVLLGPDGRIAAVAPHSAATGGPDVTDLGATALLPGLVDTHVHINEPGRTEWEGFATATAAAAAGGVTTLLDMPLNSVPPTTTVGNLRIKQDSARGRVRVDVGFWGGAVPANTGDLEPLFGAGVFGFKSFLSPSGVEEFPHLPAEALEPVLAELARIGATAIVHAEAPEVLDAAPRHAGRAYLDWVQSRPPAAETAAVARLLDAARATGARVHVLHVSSAQVLPLLAAARADGVRVTAETCPHYLTLAAEQVPEGGTAFKCCPPIRDEANRDALWKGLGDGAFMGIVSDHSPCTAELKAGDFAAAWGGVASLQLGLPAVWTEAARRGFGLADVVRWMAAGPAGFAGLDDRKGAIAPGRDADLVAFDPEEEFTVDPARLHHRNPVTAYAGRTLRGVVRTTWLRGRVVELDGEPRGELVARRGA
ncbi:allantoinase AllB [Mangrovactinospora gilvigrisea]|uniref:allantoinase AllB n=1 Tax=Mangrovactinospora gilvigrisea TaxID=1428644 RepID=UPI000A795668|nr:allantoinase AllB [Mangrovactinospora gilvigrisea]